MFITTMIATLVAAALWTERRERPLTDEARKRLAALLREHDYPAVRLVALRFAYRLTRNRDRAQDLMGRADLRLVRFGWDPYEVPLVKRLCRLVWSEWTNSMSEADAARHAEEEFLREMEATVGSSARSAENLATEQETERESKAEAVEQVEALRESFRRAGDEVNLLWLDYQLRGETDLQEMARASGRDVKEFYRAADRRKRHTRKLLARRRGVNYDQEEEG